MKCAVCGDHETMATAPNGDRLCYEDGRLRELAGQHITWDIDNESEKMEKIETTDQALARIRQLEQAKPEPDEYWREVRAILSAFGHQRYEDGWDEGYGTNEPPF